MIPIAALALSSGCTERESPIDSKRLLEPVALRPVPAGVVCNRSTFATVYCATDGEKTARISTEPLNYEGPDGAFRSIDPRIRPVRDRGYDFAVEQGPLQVYWKRDVSQDAAVRVEHNGFSVSFRVDRLEYHAGDATQVLATTRGGSDVPEVRGNRLTHRNVFFDGVDLEFAYDASGLHKNLIINARSTLPTPDRLVAGLDLRLRERLDISDALTLHVDGAPYDGSTTTTARRLELLDENHDVVFTIPAGAAFDGAPDPSEIALTYTLEGPAGAPFLYTHVPYAWLADETRVFPVAIDPTITSTFEPAIGASDGFVNCNDSNGGGPESDGCTAANLIAGGTRIRWGRRTTSVLYLDRGFAFFPLDSIPSSALITDTTLTMEMAFVSAGWGGPSRTLITGMGNTHYSLSSPEELWNQVMSVLGEQDYVAQTSLFTNSPGSNTRDLGANGDALVQSNLVTNLVGLGFKDTSEASVGVQRDVWAHSWEFDPFLGPQLEVTFCDDNSPPTGTMTFGATASNFITLEVTAVDVDCSGLHPTYWEVWEVSTGTPLGWLPGNSFLRGGLSTNTQYGYIVQFRDVRGNTSGFGPTQNHYTLATFPPAPAISGITDITMTIDIGAGTNPAATDHSISCTGASCPAGWVDNTGAFVGTEYWWTAAPTGVTVTGLSPSTQYCFGASARNGDGVVTGPTSPVCATTVECVDDAGCGLCEQCTANVCVNQGLGSDLKSECSFDECNTGTCNSFGACGFAVPGAACTDTVAGDCNVSRCDGAGACDQAYGFEAGGYECRADNGLGCDAPEVCSGTVGGPCPADVGVAIDTPCNAALDTECDAPELCDGSSSACPGQSGEVSAGTSCTDSAPADCDDAQCDGAGLCDQSFATEVRLPVADAGPDASVPESTLVTLDGSGSSVGCGGLAAPQFSWSVVSGPAVTLTGTSTPAPSFVAPDVGVDTPVVIELVVSNGVDLSAPETVVITIQDVGGFSAPVVVEPANGLGTVGIAYVYDDDGCAEATGTEPITWAVVTGPAEFNIDATTGCIGWVPASAGATPITIEARNADGVVDFADEYAFTVDVAATAVPAPIAMITTVPQPAERETPLGVFFDGSLSTPAADIVSYRWKFGDGTPDEFGQTVFHEYIQPAGYTAQLVVTNGAGLTGAETVSVRVLQQGARPPIANIVASPLLGEGALTTSFSCDCVAGDGAIEAYRWDFGDASSSQNQAVDHTFAPGMYRIRLVVLDENGLSGSDTIEVVVSENSLLPPTVKAGARPSVGPAPLTVALIGLAVDLDGQIVELGWDVGGGVETAEATEVYDLPGIYSATFHAIDDSGLRSSVAVEILVTDNGLLPPLIISIPNVDATVGGRYQYDGDGVPAARGNRPLTWSLGKVVGPDILGVPAGMVVDDQTGELSWTPAADQSGDHLVTIVVANSAGFDLQEFTVTVSGGEPPDPTGKGCGCSSSRTGGSTGLLLTLCLFFLARRRR